MSWTELAELLFLACAIVAAALLAWGGWLCIEEALQDDASPVVAPPGAQPGRAESVEAGAEQRTVVAIAALTLVVPGFLIALGASSPALAADPFQQGLEAYEDARYTEAVAQFRMAAEAGNGRAQEILGFMYLHGPSLYGAAVQGDRAQAAHWFRRAAQGGREVSQHMLCVLEGRPAQTVVGRAACGRRAVALGAPGPDGMARAAASQAGTR